MVQPRRDPKTGYRVYSAADVRDALLAHQLRRGGYLLEQVAPLIAQVRSAGGVAPLASTLRDWHARLSARSRAMLTGAAELDAYLDFGHVVRSPAHDDRHSRVYVRHAVLPAPTLDSSSVRLRA